MRIAETDRRIKAPALKRQIFEALGLQIPYDRTDRVIESPPTITETIAKAPHQREEPPEGGS